MHHILKVKVNKNFQIRQIFDINKILDGYKFFLFRKRSGTIFQFSKISKFKLNYSIHFYYQLSKFSVLNNGHSTLKKIYLFYFGI